MPRPRKYFTDEERREVSNEHSREYRKGQSWFRLRIPKKETAVIEKLNSVPNKNRYILDLIKADIDKTL